MARDPAVKAAANLVANHGAKALLLARYVADEYAVAANADISNPERDHALKVLEHVQRLLNPAREPPSSRTVTKSSRSKA